MKRNVFQLVAGLVIAVGFSSCVETPPKKTPGPVSDSSSIPWNSPVSGQGQGQFGMMPQNQYRR